MAASAPPGAGISITAVKFNDSNYILWSKGVENLFMAQEKLRFLHDSPSPIHWKNYDSWLKEDARAMTWLWNSMEPHIAFTQCSLIQQSKSGMHRNKCLHKIKMYPAFITCISLYFYVNRMINHLVNIMWIWKDYENSMSIILSRITWMCFVDQEKNSE